MDGIGRREGGGVVGKTTGGRSPQGRSHWKKSESMEVLGQGPGLVRKGDGEEEWEVGGLGGWRGGEMRV